MQRLFPERISLLAGQPLTNLAELFIVLAVFALRHPHFSFPQ